GQGLTGRVRLPPHRATPDPPRHRVRAGGVVAPRHRRQPRPGPGRPLPRRGHRGRLLRPPDPQGGLRPGRHRPARARAPGRMRDRLLRAAAVACAALLAFPATGWGAPGPIDGNDFVARLDSARRLAEAGAAQPAPPKMQAVREALGLPLDVDLAGGTVHVPADGLLDGLRGTTTEDFRNADDHLAAMEDDARAAVRAKAPDAPRMAAALQGRSEERRVGNE